MRAAPAHRGSLALINSSKSTVQRRKGIFNDPTGIVECPLSLIPGNPVAAFTQAFTVLWGDVNGDHVVNALDEAGARAAQAGPFQPGTAGYNPFADLSGDGIVNLIDVGIARSRKGTGLP